MPATEELESGVGGKVGSVHFALTKGSWRVKFREVLSCTENMERIVVLLNSAEQLKKYLSVCHTRKGPGSA